MIWTAIFDDQTVHVFSTQYNSYDEAASVAWEFGAGRHFALIKGNHGEVEFF